MRKHWFWVAVAVVAIAFAGVFWADHFRVRATQAQIDQSIAAKYGSGPPIICVPQDNNHEHWRCRSARWGDDPICRPVNVGWFGHIEISRETPACE